MHSITTPHAESLADDAFELSCPRIPGLRGYYVLSCHTLDPSCVERLALAAHRTGRALARRHHGDPDGYTLIYNGAATRRSPWPHVHILVTRSVAEKRRAMTLLHLKHLLRWWRWPLLRDWPALQRLVQARDAQRTSARERVDQVGLVGARL